MVEERTSRRVFVGLVLLAIVLVAFVVRPFAKALFLAAVLGGALHGWHRGLARRLGGRSNVAAGLVCLGVVLILVAPIAWLGTYVVKQTVEGATTVSSILAAEGPEGLIEKLPGAFQGAARWALERLRAGGRGLDEALQSQVQARGTAAAQAVGTALAATGRFLIQVAMMLIALYFLLVDGVKLVRWVESVSPLRPGQATELMREFRSVSIAVLLSTLATAGVQAGVAMVGYLIAGVPAPVFFGVITFVVALIPAIGGALVTVLAAGLLLAMGHPWKALFLALWGVIAVGLSDNVVKPLLVKRGMHLHGAIVFFALVGGLAAFGTTGLILGPLILAFFLALIRIGERDFGRPSPRVGAPSTPPAE